jgi:hypothetical protein
MALSPSFKSYFREQTAIVHGGAFWNCLASAETLAAILVNEGRAPWIGRLRKTEVREDGVFHGPLILVNSPGVSAWTTHYICVDRGIVYDPAGRRPRRLDGYSRSVFGEEIAIETFVAQEAVKEYLAAKKKRNPS